MKLRGTFIFIWKVLDYKCCRSEFLQLADGIAVRCGLQSNSRTFSRAVVSLKPFEVVLRQRRAILLPFLIEFSRKSEEHKTGTPSWQLKPSGLVE